MRAGKSTFFNSEQFRLDKVRRDAGAVDRYKWVAGPGRVQVQAAGEYFLANAGFALQKHGDIVICGFLEQFPGVPEASGISDRIHRKFVRIVWIALVGLQFTELVLQGKQLLSQGIRLQDPV